MASLSFLAALSGLTGVIWVTQALKDFDLLTSKGQSMLIFFSAISLIIPSLVMIIAPIALFAAILFTLNKLNSDSELIVMSAAGLSPGRLLRPFAMLMVLVALLVGAMSLWIMPSSSRRWIRDLCSITASAGRVARCAASSCRTAATPVAPIPISPKAA